MTRVFAVMSYNFGAPVDERFSFFFFIFLSLSAKEVDEAWYQEKQERDSAMELTRFGNQRSFQWSKRFTWKKIEELNSRCHTDALRFVINCNFFKTISSAFSGIWLISFRDAHVRTHVTKTRRGFSSRCLAADTNKCAPWMWQLAARAVDRGGKGKRQKEGRARGEDNKAKALSTSCFSAWDKYRF